MALTALWKLCANGRIKIRFIQVRHEESAAFMACGYAKYTGKLGVCLATSGPGGLHLLNGLYDAKLDGQPVLAITGHHYHDLISTYQQQDVDLDLIFKDVALYSTRVMSATHVQNVADSGLSYRAHSAEVWRISTSLLTFRSRKEVSGRNEMCLGILPMSLPGRWLCLQRLNCVAQLKF